MQMALIVMDETLCYNTFENNFEKAGTVFFMANEEYKKYEDRMKKVIEKLITDYKGIRAGRANPGILEKVHIDYYGVPTPISQIGNISVPDARTLLIQPWDASVLKEIEKAITASDIGIMPANDGKLLRLAFPQLTEERRIELTKTVKKHADEAKIAVRNVRRDAVEEYKVLKKKSEITEDDLLDVEKEVQKITDKYCEEIDKIAGGKDKEILEV